MRKRFTLPLSVKILGSLQILFFILKFVGVPIEWYLVFLPIYLAIAFCCLSILVIVVIVLKNYYRV
jgi:ABC-type polysaccharide/polyol phosphate export permease